MKARPDGGVLGFKIIGAFKLASGLLLLAVGFGIFRLIGGDVGGQLAHVISRLRLDPDSHLLHTAIAKLGGIDRKHLKAIGFGTFFYAGLHFLEGTGLLLQRRWAGFLTVFITGSLIPFEAYEVVLKFNLLKLGVLVANAAIVVYLIVKLRQESRSAIAPDAATAAEGSPGEP